MGAHIPIASLNAMQCVCEWGKGFEVYRTVNWCYALFCRERLHVFCTCTSDCVQYMYMYLNSCYFHWQNFHFTIFHIKVLSFFQKYPMKHYRIIRYFAKKIALFGLQAKIFLQRKNMNYGTCMCVGVFIVWWTPFCQACDPIPSTLSLQSVCCLFYPLSCSVSQLCVSTW